ncbi:kinase-like protein [Hypoxylon sp. FL0543]|nr:kinase-like protein [Hypoxylon sp. FL0543]
MDFESFKKDPFRRGKRLGRHSAVWVAKSPYNGESYARKEFTLRGDGGDEKLIKRVKKEISIMSRLRHHHIVEFCGSHYIENTMTIGLVLYPVAQMDLWEFLWNAAGKRRLKSAPQPDDIYGNMCRWPVCLFHAVEYIHSNGIRHKDIKPSNILLAGDRIYLTDFGASRDFSKEPASVSVGEWGDVTRRYVAPETDQDKPRGRAADVWALGCTVLEVCTVAASRSVADLNDHLRAGSRRWSLAFCDHPYPVLDWILRLVESPGVDDDNDDTKEHVRKLLQLAFLMLDPNPAKRITARQLVDLLHHPESSYFHSIGRLACGGCSKVSGMPRSDSPPYLVFKEAEGGGVFVPSRNRIWAESRDLWETARRRWLERPAA